MNVQPFNGQSAGTITISATSSSSSTPLGGGAIGSAANLAATAVSVARVVNAGPGTAFLLFGVGAQTALVASSIPMLAGTVEVFSKGLADSIGVISASTSTVYVTCGEGQ